MEVKNENDALHKELLNARNLLANVVDGNPIPTFILDKNHKVTYWNQTLEIISGIKAVDIIGTDNQWQAFYDHKRPVMADLII
ncbi:MAG: PAS domain-containing protein, partial [Desulfobacula sp.]